MSRGITSAARTAISAEQVVFTAAAELLFDGGAVRVNGTPFDITIGGHTFLGVGTIGSISSAEEGADLQAYTMALKLSGIPDDAIALAAAEPYQGRAATVWAVPIDPVTYLPVADPIVVFRGRMDTMQIDIDAGNNSVTLNLTNRLADWERVRTLLFSDEEQQRNHPGDLGLQYAAAVATSVVAWPSAEWFKVNHG